MTSELLEGVENDPNGDERKLIKKVVAVAYGAGSDTVSFSRPTLQLT